MQAQIQLTPAQEAFYKKRSQLYKILGQYKVLPSQDNVQKIEKLPIYGNRELVKDLFCIIFKRQNTEPIWEKYNGVLPLVEEATIVSYLPDLIIMANLLSPTLLPVNPLLLLRGIGDHPNQLEIFRRYITGKKSAFANPTPPTVDPQLLLKGLGGDNNQLEILRRYITGDNTPIIDFTNISNPKK